jgi:hypothetical protein
MLRFRERKSLDGHKDKISKESEGAYTSRDRNDSIEKIVFKD